MWPWTRCKPCYAGASWPRWRWQFWHSMMLTGCVESSLQKALSTVSFMVNSPRGATRLLPRLPRLLLITARTGQHSQPTSKHSQHWTTLYTLHFCHVSRPVLSGLFYWCDISQMIFLFCLNSAMVNKGWNLGCGPWVLTRSDHLLPSSFFPLALHFSRPSYWLCLLMFLSQALIVNK